MSSPLAGVTVLDLTRAGVGPFCTMILADLGADVIKVEPLPNGDMTRHWGPYQGGMGVYFISVNRNKRSLAVDFHTEEGRALLLRLATRADVVVDNFRPRTLLALGLDYDALCQHNPRAICASLSGFGHSGPQSNWPAFDQIIQGMSGLMSLTGDPDGPPMRAGIPTDLVAGLWLSLGICAALLHREQTGAGQRVSTSLLSGVLGMFGVQAQRYLSTGQVPPRTGNDHPTTYPYGAFQASDGILNIGAVTEAMWAKLCELLDLAHLASDPDYACNASRVKNRDSLRSLLNQRLASDTVARWTDRLIAAGIPAGPVLSMDQVFANAQVVHAEIVEELATSPIGRLRQVGSPVRMDSLERPVLKRPPPSLGEHSAEVLAQFGFSRGEIDTLAEQGIVELLKS